ncbi:MAG TPA: CDP-alcohol phosphatidyltransferase family protein, partial [Mycobacteriales bacterium]|nr:CDP-alcohol phosphatidyltransferase family protein [Mycobacteriales bacterium]
ALRILGVPLFVWLIVGPNAYAWAVVVLVASGATDWFDGYLARRLNQTSRLGQFLDPLADRLYIFAALISLLISGVAPIWLILAVLLRDVILLATGPVLVRYGYRTLAVNFVGKGGTMALLVAIPMLLLGASNLPGHGAITAIAWGFTIWGVAMYWIAGVLYLTQLSQIIRDRLPDTAEAGR